MKRPVLKSVYMFYIFLIAATMSLQCKKESPLLPPTEPPLRQPLAFTQAEIDTIMAGDSSTAMRVMNIFVQPDSVILRTMAKNVHIGDTLIGYLTDRMYTTVRHAGGVGIAAPQVGINRRIVWVQRYDKGNSMNRSFEVYLNPRIVEYSDTLVRRWDGCLSVPQTSDYPNVIDSSFRALWVRVEYYLPDGTIKNEKIVHWYTAHIFQHEIDHLNGIMFFDQYVNKNKHLFTILPAELFPEN
ncbi:MAG: Peptide deformylase [Bacteroidetes bacterium ADurb.Bin408]|nr:MAG: Peptide deformylase [Bacteroidetes bacterium ADurb.Bin408]